MNEKRKQGFALLTPEAHAAASSRGGKIAAAGRGRKWTLEEAREAGRKGGIATAAKKRAQ